MKHRLILVGEFEREAILNVVFIHGLTGDVYETWNGKKQDITKNENESYENIAEDKIGKDYWPSKLKQAFNTKNKRANFWSLGYPAPLTKKEDPNKCVENLRTSSLNVINTIAIPELQKQNSGKIIFIAHSLGGIIVKAIISESKNLPKEKIGFLYENIIGVAFLGTPNYGSGLANVLEFVSSVASSKLKSILEFFVKDYLTPSNAVNWLKKNNPDLRELAYDFRSVVEQKKIEVQVYYETIPYKGVLKVVDEANADPGIHNCRPTPVPGCDHNQISKPIKERGNDLHLEILKWLNNITDKLIKGTIQPVLNEDIESILNQIVNSSMEIPNSEFQITPKKLESISLEYRTKISHIFRAEAIKLSKSYIRKSIISEKLIQQLKNSNFDLDKLILFQILSLQLENIINHYQESLNKRNGEIFKAENPSLIITYELIRSIWNVLSKDSIKLKHEMKSFLSWLKRAKSKDSKLDSGGETETFVRYSIKSMSILEEWEKP